jgi:hypothetical protein
VLIQVNLPATVAAPAMARRLMEKFLPACAPPIAIKGQVHALLLVSELVTTVIEYTSAAPRRLGLSLIWHDRTFTATLSGGDGVSLVARELMDESLRGPAIAGLAHIAHRWGSKAHASEGPVVWVELDLDLAG